MEKKQERKKFQPAGEHIKHKDIFRKRGEKAKILRGAYQLQTRSDVIDRGGNGCKICDEIPSLKSNEKDGGSK